MKKHLLLLPLFVLAACSLADVANYNPYATMAAYRTETVAAASTPAATATITETHVYEG